MRQLRILALAVVLGSHTVACSGSVEEPAGKEDIDDPHPGVDDADVEDDGLGALLDGEDAAPVDAGAETSEPGDAGEETSTPKDAGADTGPTGPRCDSTAKSGTYCNGDHVTGGVSTKLYKCTGPNVAATVAETCTMGCVIAPAGTDDYCKSATGSAAADACPHVATILRWGLHPVASDRLRCAGITSSRITQTIGSAAASAGTHAQDGTASGQPYSAATDLSVSGLTDSQVKTLIAKLDTLGFAAFFRKPCYDGWPCSEARHVHVVFAGAAMKSSLRSQISDFLAGKNGLASHTTYSFYQPPPDVKAFIKKIFDAAN